MGHDLGPGFQGGVGLPQVLRGHPAAGHLSGLPNGDLSVGLQQVDQGGVVIADPAGGLVDEAHTGEGR